MHFILPDSSSCCLDPLHSETASFGHISAARVSILPSPAQTPGREAEIRDDAPKISSGPRCVEVLGNAAKVVDSNAVPNPGALEHFHWLRPCLPASI